MTDFVGRALRPETDDWIIRSLLDDDFYKKTMGLAIHRFYPNVEVEFAFINRHRHVPLADIIDEGELRKQLDHLETLRYGQRTEISYLRGQNVYYDNMFSEEYLGFLRDYQAPGYTLTRTGDQYDLRRKGTWARVSPTETMDLATLNELYYRSLMREMTRTELDIMYSRAKDKLYRKLLVLKRYPGIRFADFGYRRRHSHLWQKFCIEMAQEVLGDQFTGASSTLMAFRQNLTPIGTNAHELPMVLTALADTDDEKRDAQYEVLRMWARTFPKGGLRIVLPDTYGSFQFWKNMPKDLAEEVAHEWAGDRLDSGDPIDEAQRKIRWYAKHGVDALKEKKVAIPSNELDVGPMVKIHEALEGKIDHPYGWGTLFSNDFRGCHPRGNELVVIRGKKLAITWDEAMKGHSFVSKPAKANGRPVVKLSNNTQKATGPKEEIERYLRIFGHEGIGSQDVVV